MGQAKLKNVQAFYADKKYILHATASSNWFDGVFVNYVSPVLHHRSVSNERHADVKPFSA